MRSVNRILAALTLLASVSLGSHAASVTFTSRELFRVPFGDRREALGARIEGGNFIFPRDFTMDGAGHFYIYDSNKHRIARFSSDGHYELGFAYSASAEQIFAHADSRQNLWLLISDPQRGVYYGVYDPRGKRLKEGIFSTARHFQLHLDDNATLHVILSVPGSAITQTYIFDEESLLMKKEAIARPPENHHRVHLSDHVYFIDQVPDGSRDDAHHVNRVTNEAHHSVANIRGTVIYVTDRGDVYTRVSDREIYVYSVEGDLEGKILLKGLSSACASIRFDGDGNLYELDGIPDEKDQYSASMPGMRLIQWDRR